MSYFDKLITDYPVLSECRNDIEKAFDFMCQTYESGGSVYVCGNGGSAADCQHIVGELMKGFEKKRTVAFPPEVSAKLSPETRKLLESKLQGALPCHSLTSENALIMALSNDISADIVFAQQIYGYGRKGDSLICISTSGNAYNVCLAAELAKAIGLHTIAMTDRSGGILCGICDTVIRVPADITAEVQELHLPVYHALCRAVEGHFFVE